MHADAQAASSEVEDDLALLRRARQGDWDAFETLVSRFEPKVFRIAWRIMQQQHDAEDVTQQTFLSVMENLDKFREEASVSTWILRIATNHALQILRKRRGLKMVPLDGAAVPGEENYASIPHPEYVAQWKETPIEMAQRSEVRTAVGRALEALDEKHALVFVLRDIEGYSTQQTAEILDLSVSNVKVRLLRARLQLRESLTRQFGDEAHRILMPHVHE